MNDNQYKVKLEDIQNKLSLIELKYGLFNEKINDVYIWNIINKPIFDHIRKKLTNSYDSHPYYNIGIFQRINRVVRKKSILSKYNALKNINQIDTIVFRHNRRIKIDNAFVDVNTEYLKYIIPDICCAEYVDLDILFTEKERTKENINLLVPQFKERIVQSINYIIDKELISAISKYSKKISSLIIKEFNCEINVNRLVRSYYNDFVYKSKFYYKYLKVKKPKKIYVVVSYSHYSLINAAKKLGIKVIEIQHGLISATHRGYSFPNGTVVPYFPDKLLLYGDYWKKNIKFPIPETQLEVVGNPYYEMQVNKYTKYNKISNTVLFISAGDFGKQLSKLACLFSKKYKDYKIIYKLHPGEFYVWKKVYPWLLNNNIEVVEDNTNLFQLFATSDFLVSVASTAIYESFAFGPKIVLYNTDGVEKMKDIISSYNIPLINNEDELYNMFKIEKNSVQINRDYFYKTLEIKS